VAVAVEVGGQEVVVMAVVMAEVAAAREAVDVELLDDVMLF
jgi:hypothetical protein